LILEDALKEIAEYQKRDFNEVLEQYNEISKKVPGYVKWSNLSADEWDKMDIDESNVHDVMEFYKNTPNYIFELMEYHSTDAKQRLSNSVIDICKENNFNRILDFGAGVCQDSINAAKNDFDATAVDIPGKTFNFGKWRIKKQNLKIDTIDISDEAPIINNYDSITCFEVLQHVVNPKKTLSHLRDHLEAKGILFITTRFKNNYSLALKHNEYLETKFEEFVGECNLKIIDKKHMWGENEKAKFLYLLKK